MIKHAHEKPFDPRCLHCLINFTLEAWAVKNAQRGADGEVRLDAAKAISDLSQVMGEIVYHAKDEAMRKHFERFAHTELERAFHAQSLGNVIVVSFNRDAAA